MADEAAPAPKAPKGPLILVIGNTVAVLATLGALLYTRVLYQRPPITEQSERKRLATGEQDPQLAIHEIKPGEIAFDKFTATIKPAPEKTHYLTLTFTLEIRDASKAPKIEEIKPVFKDKLLTSLGYREFAELNTVQGRYLLRSEIIQLVNELAGEQIATNVFFTEFIVQ